jgi:F0F1-type ATP synthase assembly protein I
MAHPSDPQRPSGSRAGRDQSPSDWYRLTGVGFEFIAAIFVLGGLGWWLDSRLKTTPWLMIAGAGLGFAAGLWLLIRAAFRSFRD